MARRHESLIPLSHEHHDALLLAWRMRTGDLSKREPELRAKHARAFFEYRLVNPGQRSPISCEAPAVNLTERLGTRRNFANRGRSSPVC